MRPQVSVECAAFPAALTRMLRVTLVQFNQTAIPANTAAVAVSLVSPRRMFQLSRVYRAKPHATDILAFPSTESRTELQQCLARVGEPFNLGHIVLCPAVIRRRLGGGESLPPPPPPPPYGSLVFRERLRRLLAHGYAHLFHHDHHEVDDFRQMRRFENQLLRAH